jgi:hypothetical protein
MESGQPHEEFPDGPNSSEKLVRERVLAPLRVRDPLCFRCNHKVYIYGMLMKRAPILNRVGFVWARGLPWLVLIDGKPARLKSRPDHSLSFIILFDFCALIKSSTKSNTIVMT